MVEERPRILVVDDDQLIRDLLADQLGPHFDITTTASGPEALEVLVARPFAVLLADQRMPEMSGVQLASLARKAQPYLVSILLSAYTDPKDTIAAINEGQVFRFVQKPWEEHDLVHALHQAVARHRLARDNARLVTELERRLVALEILQEVAGAAGTGTGTGTVGHPAHVLLRRLSEALPFDLAAVLFAPGKDAPASLELYAQDEVSEGNALALRDRAGELFAEHSGQSVDDSQIRVRLSLRVAHGSQQREVQSEVHVPLVGEGSAGSQDEARVTGVLVLQSFSEDAYPSDVSRELDLLANGTAEALERMRQRTGRHWLQVERTLGAMPDGIILTDGQGVVQLANNAARRFLGAGAGLADVLWQELVVSPRDVLAATPAPVTREFQIGTRHLRASAAAAPTTRGDEPAILVVVRDETETHQAAVRRRQFVSTVSHEIRTPLSSIVAALDLLLNHYGGGLTGQQERYLGAASKACDSLDTIVGELLDLERFAVGAVPLRYQRVNLVTLAREAVARYEASAQEAGVGCALHASGDELLAEVDPSRIQQVLGNLLSNAIKFAPANSIIGVQLVPSEQVPGWIVVGIDNGGEPIDAEDLEGIFERFKQARTRPRSESPEQAGSGLGLTICRSLVRAHGGWILAESDEQRTTLWVALPTRTPVKKPGRPVHFEPVWLQVNASDADRVVATAVVAQCGLGARLLPKAEARRPKAGQPRQGILLRIGVGPEIQEVTPEAPLGPALSVPLWGTPSLASVAKALASLAQLGFRPVTLDREPPAGLGEILSVLGLRWSHAGDDQAVIPSGAGMSCTEALVALAEQVSCGRVGRGQIQALYRGVRAAEGGCFAVVHLRHLGGYRAAYGVANAVQLKRALEEDIGRVVATWQDAEARLLSLDEAVLCSGPWDLLANLAECLPQRFQTMAGLHYRRRDRDLGAIHCSDGQQPLVTLGVELLGPEADFPELLAAAGMT